MELKHYLKKIWHFIWEEDSLLSWIVNVILAFVLVKFLIYPGLGLLLGTQFPVVAVVSESMEHNGNLDQWWQSQEKIYSQLEITKEEFQTYPLTNGFNKGDLIILIRPSNLKKGDVIVFKGEPSEPIIHRIVKADDGTYQTKGDHNLGSRQDELNITPNLILGKAALRVPLLGWFKLLFTQLLQLFKF